MAATVLTVVKFVTCPLDEAHKVMSTRLQHHLVRCLKQYKGTKVRCPFNATEYIEPHLMPTHIAECQSRAVKEAHYFYSQNLNYKYTAPFLHAGPPETNENWGLE